MVAVSWRTAPRDFGEGSRANSTTAVQVNELKGKEGLEKK